MQKSLHEITKFFWSLVITAIRTGPYLFNMGEKRREATELYPDPISSRTPDELPARSRGVLHNDIQRCTGCRECETICPTKAIALESEVGPDTSKVWIGQFDIDLGRCIQCGYCVEVCPPNSLIHTRKYEVTTVDRPSLVIHFGRGRITEDQRAKWALMREAAQVEIEKDNINEF